MTKQMHRYIRERQQFYKAVNRKCKYKNPHKHRNRNWWKAYHRTMKAEWKKGTEE